MMVSNVQLLPYATWRDPAEAPGAVVIPLESMTKEIFFASLLLVFGCLLVISYGSVLVLNYMARRSFSEGGLFAGLVGVFQIVSAIWKLRRASKSGGRPVVVLTSGSDWLIYMPWEPNPIAFERSTHQITVASKGLSATLKRLLELRVLQEKFEVLTISFSTCDRTLRQKLNTRLESLAQAAA